MSEVAYIAHRQKMLHTPASLTPLILYIVIKSFYACSHLNGLL